MDLLTDQFDINQILYQNSIDKVAFNQFLRVNAQKQIIRQFKIHKIHKNRRFNQQFYLIYYIRTQIPFYILSFKAIDHFYPKMSTFTSRYSISSHVNPNNLKPNFCYSTGQNFNKNKDVSQMFLDKKTIIKKLQKLMLDVKDLQTKMFVSKTISFIQNNQYTQKHGEHSNHSADMLNSQDKQNIDLFASTNCSQIKKTQRFTMPITNSTLLNQKSSLTNSMIMNSYCHQQTQNNLQQSITNQMKYMNETATSQGFLNNSTSTNFMNLNNPANKQNQTIIQQQTNSEAGTVCCECGLFEGLLKMISSFIECGLIKQVKENDTLEIDEEYLQKLSQEILNKFNQVEAQREQSKSSLLSLTEDLVKKQSSVYQLTQQLKSQNKQLYQLRAKTKICQKFHSNMQKDIFMLKQQKSQIGQKLAVCLRQIQQLTENKKHEINSLKFQLELKDNQIVNLRTIIESLEKRTKQYDDQIKSMKKAGEEMKKEDKEKNDRKQKVQKTTLCYKFQVPQFLQRKSSVQQQLYRANQQNIFYSLKLQNEQLRQQCLLLYERVNQFQLFNKYEQQTN